jgi:hypothetical protein
VLGVAKDYGHIIVYELVQGRNGKVDFLVFYYNKTDVFYGDGFFPGFGFDYQLFPLGRN